MKLQKISSMPLSDVVEECTARLEMLDRIKKVSTLDDLRTLKIYGTVYAPFQFFYTADSPDREEHATAVLIGIKNGDKVLLSFEAEFDEEDGMWSEAHSYLTILRSVCKEWGIEG